MNRDISYASKETLSPLRSDMEGYLREYAGQRVLYLPNPGNGGDSLIATATMQAFARCGVRAETISLDSEVAGEIVFLGGGGNLIPLYRDIRLAIERFQGKVRRLIILPHTLRGNEQLLRQLDANWVIFCRDRESFHWLNLLGTPAEIRFAHDMAFHLDTAQLMKDPGIADRALPIFRSTVEKMGLSEREIQNRASMRYARLDREAGASSPTSDMDISDAFMLGVDPIIAPVAAWCMLHAVELARCVETDRLHVAIAAALVGTPCILRDNSYGKNSAVFRGSLAGHFANHWFVEEPLLPRRRQPVLPAPSAIQPDSGDATVPKAPAPDTKTKTSATKVPRPAPENLECPPAANHLANLVMSAAAGADFVFAPTAETLLDLSNRPRIAEVSLIADADGRTFLCLAGGEAEAPSSGFTGGYSLRVPDAFELAASGKRIRICAVARVKASAPPARLAIAYSTNDVGNSEWRWLSVRPEWKALTIDYDVPLMDKGGGDFIGLLPDKPGAPPVEIAIVSATVLPAEDRKSRGS